MFPDRVESVLDGLAGRLGEVPLDAVRGPLLHGEEEEAMDALAASLVCQYATLTTSEHAELADLFAAVSAPPDRYPFLHHAPLILDVLPRGTKPGRSRDLPPMRGGHEPWSVRPGASTFGDDWDRRRIETAADEVRRTAEPVVLSNGRTWTAGRVHDTRIGVLRDALSTVAVVPLVGAVRPWPDPLPGPPRPSGLGLLVARSVATYCGLALHAVRRGLGADEFDSLAELQAAGEWAEVADAVAALLRRDPPGLSPVDRSYVRSALRGFDLPVEGCAFVNDRDAILNRLDQR